MTTITMRTFTTEYDAEDNVWRVVDDEGDAVQHYDSEADAIEGLAEHQAWEKEQYEEAVHDERVSDLRDAIYDALAKLEEKASDLDNEAKLTAIKDGLLALVKTRRK